MTHREPLKMSYLNNGESGGRKKSAYLVEDNTEEKKADVKDFVDHYFSREADDEEHGAAAEDPVLHQSAFNKGSKYSHHPR